MTGPGAWRNVRSIMFATVQVAAVASLLRHFQRPTHPSGSGWLWVVIALLSLVTWPISRGIWAAIDRRREENERRCPICRRSELRPLVKPGGGIFQEVSSFRCRACWTTIRLAGDSLVLEPFLSNQNRANPAGITFLDEPRLEGEIRFLEDRPNSLD